MIPADCLDLQPYLVGELLELRPLRPDDWEALFEVASDPLIWELHPAHDRYKEDVFRGFFEGALGSRGALVALDRKTGEIIGSSRYFWQDTGELEIGWTFLARAYWGGVHNREMKRLMLDHAFQVVDRVIFSVGVDNLRSRRAMEKIGGTRTDGVLPRPVAGAMIDHVIYEIRRPHTIA